MQNYIKRERRKNIIFVTFILLFASIVTHKIYYDFKDERNVDYTSESLEVTFHEKSGDKILLNRITPVTDSVGLSSKAYTFTVKNNLSTSVKYSVSIMEDLEAIVEDDCGEYQIPHDIIKMAIHKDKEDNEIYILDEIEDAPIIKDTLDGNEEVEYTLRFWTTNNNLTIGGMLHYHGIIKVSEENSDIATSIN